MPEFEIEMYGSRSKKEVTGKLTLKVEAENREQAFGLVRDSLPGFDWKWTSTWGLIEKTKVQ